MKKLSFFLMAMLMSVMSFAQTELFTQTYPGSPSSYTNAYTKSFTVTTGDYTLTYTNINNGQESNAWTAIRSGSKNGASVATIASKQIAAPIAKVVINFTQANAGSTNALYLEVSANSDFSSVTKIEADIAVGNVEFPIATPAANQYYKITIDQAKGSANGFNRFDKVVFYQGEAAGEDVEIVAAPEFSVTEANFTTAFTLDITSEEGTTLKYTIDNTDPSTSATAIEVATNSTSVQITKSTAVKAIAIKGELKSVTKSKVYCYVNSAETAYTVAEAMEVIDAGLGLANELYVKGEISEIEKFDANYGSITYWIKDEEGNKFECYSGLGLNKAKFTSVDGLVVGSKVVVCGVMKKYNTIYEFNYNNYIVSLELPVVSYVVTVSANPAEAGTVTGGGEYEQGDTATLNATAAEGYEFTCWTEGTDTVATTAEYAFEVLANRNLVANFEEADQKPSYETVELTMTNLDVDDDFTTFVGSETMYGVSVSLLPDLTKPIEGMDMTYGLKAGSTLTFSGQNLEIVDGYMTIEMGMTTTVYAVVLAKFGEEQYMFSITMTEPAETQEITETDATVTYEFGALKFLVELEDEDFVSVEVAGFKYPGNVTDQLVEGQQIATFENAAAFAIANKVYVTVANDTLVEVYGEYTSNFGATYNVTISGVLPVYTVAVTAENGTVTGAGTYIAAQEATLVATAAEGYEFVNWTVNGKEESDEATYTFLAEANVELVANFKEAAKPTISYELNGGAFPTVAVPTAAELLMAFKVDYLAAFNITDATDSDMNVREAGNFIWVMNSKGGDAVKFITENANWKWLHDYILSVAGNIPEGTNVSFYWRANIDGFFHCKNAVAVGGVASADYTEAGKPEVWGAAYQAAKGIVLPTEPVAEAYTLPTPTKEGSVFQGWYDNAEGQGEAMTVIPAGWYGTLYAIWTVEGGTTTGLDNAPVVMDVVKVIKNGQLVIIRNGVEYNANGAILK